MCNKSPGVTHDLDNSELSAQCLCESIGLFHAMTTKEFNPTEQNENFSSSWKILQGPLCLVVTLGYWCVKHEIPAGRLTHPVHPLPVFLSSHDFESLPTCASTVCWPGRLLYPAVIVNASTTAAGAILSLSELGRLSVCMRVYVWVCLWVWCVEVCVW